MAEEIMLNNYSDDSRIKQYIQNVLMPQVFKNIPITTLNAGGFSIFSEYMSQAIENMSFTSSFYFNESFITKAVLPDSIYSEAAIFNIGYAFAIPSSCNFLLELKIEDIIANAKLLILSPPKKKITNNTSNVVVEVLMVRANVELRDWLNSNCLSRLG